MSLFFHAVLKKLENADNAVSTESDQNIPSMLDAEKERPLCEPYAKQMPKDANHMLKYQAIQEHSTVPSS